MTREDADEIIDSLNIVEGSTGCGYPCSEIDKLIDQIYDAHELVLCNKDKEITTMRNYYVERAYGNYYEDMGR